MASLIEFVAAPGGFIALQEQLREITTSVNLRIRGTSCLQRLLVGLLQLPQLQLLSPTQSHTILLKLQYATTTTRVRSIAHSTKNSLLALFITTGLRRSDEEENASSWKQQQQQVIAIRDSYS